MPINQLGTITTHEPRMINIQVWDLNNVILIDSSIKKSELGLNPQIDGQLIRLPIPDLSEEIMLNRDISINKYHQGKLHFNIISSKKSVDTIKDAKNNQSTISCGTSIYHLLFDDQQLDGFNAQFKILPPFRRKLDRDALLEGVKNGVIDVITSYHQPNEEEVNNVEFSIAPFGIIGTQITFPLALTYLLDYLGLEKIIQCMSINPRTILQCEVPIIKEGHKVDITLFDPNKKWTYNKENNNSKSENTPLFGTELKGFVHGTLIGSNYHQNLPIDKIIFYTVTVLVKTITMK